MRRYAWVIMVLLTGYAFFGRGFAYVGIPPLFIGEIVLALGLVVFLRNRPIDALRLPLIQPLGIFMALGALATAPYVGEYGLDALRDAVLWGYGIYAVLVAMVIVRLGRVDGVVESYGRWVPWFILWAPVVIVLYRLYPTLIPQWPNGVYIISPKRGDYAVHLAGVLAFTVLGVRALWSTKAIRSRPGQEWLLWGFWLAGCATVMTSRGALLTVLGVGVVLVLSGARGRWAPLVGAIALGAAAFVALDVEVRLGKRTLSVDGLFTTAQSVFGEASDDTYDGSRRWRIMWWKDIVNYTVYGEYFWTGKGFGVNLATEDGYQVTGEDALRSPHNGHMSILARMGVPGAAAWAILQTAFAVGLWLTYLRAKRAGRSDWAALNLWVLCYWIAGTLNGAFDVYLEGPQGGIWFWCIFGCGMGLMALQREGYGPSPAPTPPPGPARPPEPGGART